MVGPSVAGSNGSLYKSERLGRCPKLTAVAIAAPQPATASSQCRIGREGFRTLLLLLLSFTWRLESAVEICATLASGRWRFRSLCHLTFPTMGELLRYCMKVERCLSEWCCCSLMRWRAALYVVGGCGRCDIGREGLETQSMDW